jgi:hypothetical protein
MTASHYSVYCDLIHNGDATTQNNKRQSGPHPQIVSPLSWSNKRHVSPHAYVCSVMTRPTLLRLLDLWTSVGIQHSTRRNVLLRLKIHLAWYVEVVKRVEIDSCATFSYLLKIWVIILALHYTRTCLFVNCIWCTRGVQDFWAYKIKEQISRSGNFIYFSAHPPATCLHLSPRLTNACKASA